MRDMISIREWVAAFEAGAFDSPDRRTQCEAGWYDWFCRDTSLANKTRRMGSIVRKVRGGKVDIDRCYVWFKNNCPLNGPLYDDFRFADRETGEVQFTITIACCWNEKRYAVYGRTPDGVFQEKPLFETDSARELEAWLNEPWAK